MTTTSMTDTMSATTTGNIAASTTPGGVVYTGYVGAAATATASGKTSNANSLAIRLGQAYGVAVVLAGFFVGFACML